MVKQSFMKTIHWALMGALACAAYSAQAKSPRQPLEQWQTYAPSTSLSTANLGDYQAVAVFYRLDNVNRDTPVNVYVDGRYQASLLPNTHSTRAVCADKQVFGAAWSRTDGFERDIAGVRETLPLREVAFFRVEVNAAGQPELVRVPAEQAEQEFENTRLLTQTLSRATPQHQLQCQAPVLQTNQLSASALFGFNQYQYEAIVPTAYAQLAEISKKINHLGEAKIQKIVVAGHADPEGADEYNQQLSLKRAQVIAQALRERGGVKLPIEAVGLGKTELKMPHCASQHPHDAAARHACNQPNRRVEITVYGRE